MAEVFFLSVLVLIGGLILYEDFKKGRIRNSFLVILIGAGIFLNYYTGVFANQLFPCLVNICFGIAVGLIIWFAGLWSAADAKLYMSLVLLFPIIWFKSPSGYFPGMAILINSTLPLALVLISQVLAKSNWGEKIQAAKQILKPPFLANIFIISAGAIILRNIIVVLSGIQMDYFLTLPLFLGLFWLVSRLKIKIIYFFTVIIIFSLIFFPQMIDLSFFITTLIFSLLMLIAMWVVSLAQPLLSRQVKIIELKEGMILNEMILSAGQRFVKQPLAFLTFLTSLTQRVRSKPIFGYNPDGLKMNEIGEIQEMASAGQLDFETIGIAKTLPFAYALFLGILITYFLRDSFLAVI